MCKAELSASAELEESHKGRASSQSPLAQRLPFSLLSKSIITHSHSTLSTPTIMLRLNFFLALLSLLIGISSAHTDLVGAAESKPPPPVVVHIEKIQELVVEMESAVKKWDGDVLTGLGIMSASDSLLEAIANGTETAKGLEKKMNAAKAIKVKRATKKLLKQIESSLGSMLQSKILFDHAGLTSLMISKLEETKESAEGFIAAIVEKLKVGKGQGRRLGEKISKAFDSAIADWSKEP